MRNEEKSWGDVIFMTQTGCATYSNTPIHYLEHIVNIYEQVANISDVLAQLGPKAAALAWPPAASALSMVRPGQSHGYSYQMVSPHCCYDVGRIMGKNTYVRNEIPRAPSIMMYTFGKESRITRRTSQSDPIKGSNPAIVSFHVEHYQWLQVGKWMPRELTDE
jgi:hypothetical protein